MIPSEEWLINQQRNLVDFGAGGFDSRLGGFGRLQADGTVLRERGLETWVNCRAIYCFALDLLSGNESSRTSLDLGANALLGPLFDQEYGGWYSGVSPEGVPHNDARKEAYSHAFVLLAASSLKAVGSKDAGEIFSRIDSVITEHFWSEEESATLESWTRDWRVLEPYRGVNSNMHMTEASLAAFDVTSDEKWLYRAEGITEKMIANFARGNSWRIPEHFDSEWTPDFEYNTHERTHPFRPYGATPGHGFEWARLVLQLSEGIRRVGREVPQWHVESAESLFERSALDGWNRNGSPGFCYTVDFEGSVVTNLHLAWVACEALSAALVLEKAVGDGSYKSWIETLWDYCDEHLVDRELGGWKTELDSQNRPSSIVWGDKPDFYHPLQTVLFPRADLGPSLLGALGHIAER